MIFIKDETAISENSGDILIFPLYKNELDIFKDNVENFEKYINLKYDGEFLTEKNFENKFNKLYNQIDEDKENWAFNTIWTIVVLPRRTIVGSINFKGTPSENGEVEIEFAINEKFNNNNYTTEALNLFSNWAFKNNVKKLKAKTDKSNFSAKRVLEKNDFVLKDENDLLCFYEKEVR